MLTERHTKSEMRGEYVHFRCDRHEVEGHHQVGQYASYKCAVCGNPAKAYWYRGDKFQHLPHPSLVRDIMCYPY